MERELFRSKVARRIFLLFVLCALVPIASLAVLSYGLVTKQLDQQSRDRLHHASKSVGMSIVERLHTLDSRLERMAFWYERAGVYDLPRQEGGQEEHEDFFLGAAVISASGDVTPIYKTMEHPWPVPAVYDRDRLSSGGSQLVAVHPPRRAPRIFMVRAVDPDHVARGTLLSEVNALYLWNPETLPPLTELVIVDDQHRLLFSTLPDGSPVTEILRQNFPPRFEWRHGGVDYVAKAWPIPLKYSFGISSWTVVLSESKANVLAPMMQFRTIFPLVILVSLWFVLLLSMVQIRRNMVPLEKLREGTKRIADQQFDSRVEVSSGDEFQELARSFNAMAGQLGLQFKLLSAMAELDRAILSTLSTREIVDTVLARLPDILPCDRVSVTVMDSSTEGGARILVGGRGSERREEACAVGPEEVVRLRAHRDGWEIERDRFPSFLEPLAGNNIDTALLLPIFMKNEPAAVIALGHGRPKVYSEEELARARQMTARVAVALSNARLLEDLDRHNWETLITLARVIDASSPWTLGHSERAANMAVKIGHEMGLGRDDIDNLHRGALLHDIGKLAIDRSILDKEGKLTDEERHIMRQHPAKGARILGAHRSYARAIPVVGQHHEWWNGGGYPDGLAGEEIDLLARIYAIADVYDALHSDRPYRPGLSRIKVIDFIRQGSGTQFDPAVVEAFLSVMAREKDEPRQKSLYGSPLLTT